MEDQGNEAAGQPPGALPAAPQSGADATGTASPEARGARSANSWGMLCHLSALLGFAGIPFGRILGPLVVWLIKRSDYDFVEDQGKEALNFQISMAIYTLGSAFLICLCVGLPLLVMIQIADFILIIVASIKSSSGEPFRYPLTIRFIK